MKKENTNHKMAIQPKINILSYQSIFIEALFENEFIACGTGFVAKTKSSAPYLITARHILTGRHHFTDELLDKKNASVPDSVRISIPGGIKHTVILPLKNAENQPIWYEHPKYLNKVDIAAVFLNNIRDTEFYPYIVGEEVDSPLLAPADLVSIIGFPFGKHANGFPIWLSGWIATEPELDYEDLPCFLVDCRSRSGQSGSPVVAIKHPGVGVNYDGDPDTYHYPYPVTRLLGIYSGRINDESDIGYVWKESLLIDLLNSSSKNFQLTDKSD